MDGPTLLASDAREELEEAAPSPLRTKAKLMIRPMPKACNPVPASPVKLSRYADALGSIEEDNPFGDLTHDKLRQLSGKSDLTKVTFLQLSIDTGKQSVEALGELLPSLLQLRLHESKLHSFRDLGTSLHSLQVLWLERCGVTDLDGIGALTGLRELYLNGNCISDISPLSMHDELSVVDLQGNAVMDIVQIEQLGLCPQLTALKLVENPVASIPQYRAIVISYIPHLTALDDKPITAADRTPVTSATIDLALRFDHSAGGTKLVPESPSRPPSAAKSTFDMLLDAAKDQHSSDLTHGTDVVFAGNVTSALRRRSHEHYHNNASAMDDPQRPPTPASSFPPRPSTPLQRESITATLDRACELDLTSRLSSKSRDSILHELKAWKLETSVAQVGRPETPSKRSSAKKTSSRPHTSGGRTPVREAFGESAPRRHSRSSPIKSVSKPHAVEILVLDDQTPDDSPPTFTGLHEEWTLELQALSPRIEPQAIPSFKKHIFDASQSDSDSEKDENDDDEDLGHLPLRTARKLQHFNVGDSLNAIDEWTNRLLHAEDGPVAVVPVTERCKTPKRRPSAGPKFLDVPSTVVTPVTTPAKTVATPTPTPAKSPTKALPLKSDAVSGARPADAPTADVLLVEAATYESLDDASLVVLLQGKDKANLHHLKTKESFRGFFHGIERIRLETLLRRAYGDGDKMQKRLGLMAGRTS
ncbi:hypothetical protein SDRG_02450 [Saprolegnia diclina VS20]|uniref:U2A'/phosphoprotein 32 family A C-terminal domain-containing protein n=1 Tax=Saprolegnia diclina (strain VS20) TaxID=1156394 RepID=T0SCL0_SAPDV|nr:hypothetical protein SDRG_02450 [Saprolegnia diclina VS20]EQC40562.1 hypothetical protein SDRG_02450 [Saprolegnia diclina VS20]|eukprot:XP_008606261.1 hypothetical protein SDRG_02450 [Saprolegnia diclina VS20]